MTIFGYYWLGTRNFDPSPVVQNLTAAIADLQAEQGGDCGPVIVDGGPLSDHAYADRPGARRLIDLLQSEDVLVIDRFEDLGRDFTDIRCFLDALTRRWNISLWSTAENYFYSHAELRGCIPAWRIAEPIVDRDIADLENMAKRTHRRRQRAQWIGWKSVHTRGRAKRQKPKTWVPCEEDIAVMRQIWARHQQGEPYHDIGRDLLARGVARHNGRPWCYYEKAERKNRPKGQRRIEYHYVRDAIVEIDRAIAAGDPTHPFLAGWDWESYVGNGKDSA
ncbi:MAG: serine integrase family protein [Planctomycetota bacterium]|jgi:DNA invertase Pin-like site-specific DNA recombinase